jgi:hypothetical protein
LDVGEIGWDGMYWTGLAQDRKKWMALVKAVIKVRVLYILGSFWVTAQPETSRVVLSSIQLVSWLIPVELTSEFQQFSR